MEISNHRRITTPQSLNAYIKGICDIMRWPKVSIIK